MFDEAECEEYVVQVLSNFHSQNTNIPLLLLFSATI